LRNILRVHHPNLRITDTLFPEFDSHDFAAIDHHNYSRVLRELRGAAKSAPRLYEVRKNYSSIVARTCFFLVLPHELPQAEIPLAWGALVETDGRLALVRKPIWQGKRLRKAEFVFCNESRPPEREA